MKRRILLLTTGGIGDAILSTPLLRTIAETTPCSITVIASNPNHQSVFYGNPHVSRFFLRSSPFGITLQALARLEFIDHYRTDYHLLRPSLISDKPASQIINQLNGLPPAPTDQLDLFITEREKKDASKLLTIDMPNVVIQPSGASTENKQWRSETWEEVVAARPHINFLLIGDLTSPQIRGATDLRGKLHLREAFALISLADCLIGIDSFAQHVAAATKTPAVVLFGPTDPALWGHKGQRVLTKRVHCSPCGDLLRSVICPFGRPCMTAISSDEVCEALDECISSEVKGTLYSCR